MRKKRITQARLRKYLDTKKKLELEKAALTAELTEGTEVQPGEIAASLSASATRRPDWKRAVLEFGEQELVDKIIADTPEKMVTKLLIRAKKPAIPTAKPEKPKKKGAQGKMTEEEMLDRLGPMYGG
jgi:hypothetical protein